MPSTFSVTNTQDSGSGSLRDAILLADATPGPNTIKFAIGSGHETITPLSVLPVLTNAVTLDGTSQPGYSGSPLIELDGSQAGSNSYGLYITAANCTIRGLVVNRFNGYGIAMEGGSASGNKIQGNYVGTDVTGTLALGNAYGGIAVIGGSNNLIGGTTAAQRNLVSGNGYAGVALGASTSYPIADSNLVEGNYIGTDVSGLLPLGNLDYGVLVADATNNVIGGTAAGAGNLISGNTSEGVEVITDNGQPTATGNKVQGNLIGTDRTGSNPLGNGTIGVHIESANTTAVGGTAARAANTIAFNQGAGVEVSVGTGNAIRANSLYADGGPGIVLINNGNNLQPSPVLTAVSTTGQSVTIKGTMTASPGTKYFLDFFANVTPNPSGYGDGQTYLGRASVTTNGLGVKNFTVTLSVQVPAGRYVAATATDPGGNTSPFSADVQVAQGTSPAAILAALPVGVSRPSMADSQAVSTRQPWMDAGRGEKPSVGFQTSRTQTGRPARVSASPPDKGGLVVAFPEGNGLEGVVTAGR